MLTGVIWASTAPMATSALSATSSYSPAFAIGRRIRSRAVSAIEPPRELHDVTVHGPSGRDHVGV